MVISCKVSLVLAFLFCTTYTQYVCSNCFSIANSSYYQCNGQQCQSFLWPSSYPYPYNISCLYSSSSNCYYNNGYYSSGFVQFIACNYTTEGCALCNSANTCTSCYNGFYAYVTNAKQNYQTCKKCENSIPGCQICSGQGRCSQCSLDYLAVGGICFEQDGKTVAKQSKVDGVEISLIFVAAFFGLGLIMAGFALFNWWKKNKYQPLLRTGN